MYSNLSICASNNSALREIVGSKLSLALYKTSAAIRIVVKGVLSSCDTSATKRCCTLDKFSSRKICSCKTFAMSLKELPRLAISSAPSVLILSSSWPAANFSAICAADLTGRTTCLTTTATIIAIKSMSARPPIKRVPRSKAIVRYSFSILNRKYIS